MILITHEVFAYVGGFSQQQGVSENLEFSIGSGMKVNRMFGNCLKFYVICAFAVKGLSFGLSRNVEYFYYLTNRGNTLRKVLFQSYAVLFCDSPFHVQNCSAEKAE